MKDIARIPCPSWN